jgi:D-sedoheptulose 7-phosphate isomerase
MTMDAEATREQASSYLRATAESVRRVEEECLDDVVTAASILVTSFRSGGKLLICGNGGSAADAQHLATEFVSTFTIDNLRPSIPAIALTTDTSLLTAIANDFGAEGVFERQVESLGREGDVLIAISTSGNSVNVIRAAERARTQGIRVIALTGASGGDLAGPADVAVRVPSTVTAHIQECHLAVEQLLASLVEDALYPRSQRASAKGTSGSAGRALPTTEEV